jgi:hypothetical protein
METQLQSPGGDTGRPPGEVTERELQSLAALANVEVAPAREATVLQILRLLHVDIALLETSDLEAEEPAIVFDARWI